MSNGAQMPVRTTSAVTPVVLRADLPREEAAAYWAEKHSAIVREALPHVVEYNQLHFSKTDNGFWPTRNGVVGTICPTDYDGTAELRYPSLIGWLRNAPHVRPVYFDEQNPFEAVIGYQTGQGGGRWWTAGLDENVEARMIVMFRHRKGAPFKQFKELIHDSLGPALNEAGARDLRTYTFGRYIEAVCNTPGLSHSSPAHRRHHGAVVFGADSRAQIDEILASCGVEDVVSRQDQHITSAHAWAIDRTVPGIRIRR